MPVHPSRLNQALATLAEHAIGNGATTEHEFVVTVEDTHEIPVTVRTTLGELKKKVVQ